SRHVGSRLPRLDCWPLEALSLAHNSPSRLRRLLPKSPRQTVPGLGRGRNEVPVRPYSRCGWRETDSTTPLRRRLLAPQHCRAPRRPPHSAVSTVSHIRRRAIRRLTSTCSHAWMTIPTRSTT